MQVKVLTLPFDPQAKTFACGALDEFIAGKDILSVTEHFFVHEQTPTLLLILTFREPPTPASEPPSASRRPRDGEPRDWRADLDPAALEVYDRLRAWRKDAAHNAGLAPFMVLSNAQAAQIARERPRTVAAIAAIRGLGESRAKRWGSQILALLGVGRERPAESAP